MSVFEDMKKRMTTIVNAAWFDTKLNAKKHLAKVKRSMTKIGGSQEIVIVAEMNQRLR